MLHLFDLENAKHPDAVDVKVNDQLHIDARLTVGNVEQSVSVEANAVQVETANTQVGGVVESKQILAMPRIGQIAAKFVF